MKALLVRVGVDHSFGGWNAPVDPDGWEFVYVPIPEGPKAAFHDGLARGYADFKPALRSFCDARRLDLARDLRFPAKLGDRPVHLDPDFSHLTYGDNGDRRGAAIRRMTTGDLIVFYGGFRPTRPCGHRLVYGLLGLLRISEVVPVGDVPPERWDENAHTRKSSRGLGDIVARGTPGESGRFDRLLPIGEKRERAYRVRQDVLDAWGGLGVKNGFIQRSAVPPLMLDALKFNDWLSNQRVALLARNN